ncbi:MAG TPA: extracellular solute-binding protein [Candidatus Binatia bacterium]|jgi:iron(III) transport system substrate-binding protein|nr:extracellular solute-binding protein [Candidatus Binatia bacterium]
MMIARNFLSAGLFWVLLFAPAANGQQDKAVGALEWDKLVDAAKKEGKVTVSLPASAEMKKQIEEQFKKRYGVEVETFTARGSAAVRRMADEFKAGVRYFDLHIGGSSSIVSGMLDEGILDPIEPWLALPEVKDPKQWWGGHLWVDNAKRFVYTFQAYLSEVIWYNTDLIKPSEIRSLDDFLNPKWKGRIGYLDPRTPGAGDSTWAFLWSVKGEEYLKKLVAQDLYLGRDQRLLAESLARGRVAVVIGLSYYSYLPFLKVGLPIKVLPTPKEGNYGTGGSGNLAIIKAPAHPNSTKVFVNWLLGREGQEIVSKALGQATRRLDVDTRFLRESGTIAAKDVMSVNDFLQIENQSEEKLDKVREPAAKFAHALLK